MDNYAIADQLSLLSKLMDIHGENAFKAKAYAATAFALEKLPQAVAELPRENISSLKGIGDSAAKKIIELLETGEMSALQQLLAQTPEGVLEMMSIKGLGPKKIHTLWKELHINSIEALQEACENNRIADQKGFGEKTQQNILEAIKYQQENSGKYLYVQVEAFAEALHAKLQEKFMEYKIKITGEFRRQMDVIETLEWVTTVPYDLLKKFFDEPAFQVTTESTHMVEYLANGMLKLRFHFASDATFDMQLFETTGSAAFVSAFKLRNSGTDTWSNQSEHEVFKKSGLPFIPPYLREAPAIIDRVKQQGVPTVVQLPDIKGLIHAHSSWSDGGYSIREMAEELIRTGFEYLVISDHSKAAFYANGLTEVRVREQHLEINALNKELAPFKIFKSIECDILNDGDMDFSPEVLSSFDVVIASVHSNLQMTEEKAMKRLLGAITNPYVSILGHMTGRLLTKRKGYPVDHKSVIDACVENNVVIEINASPQRLDMDWRWIDYALQQGVLLSINPDAHTMDDYRWLKYGTLVAQKGGLTKEQNLSSRNLAAFETFVHQQQQKRPTTR